MNTKRNRTSLVALVSGGLTAASLLFAGPAAARGDGAGGGHADPGPARPATAQQAPAPEAPAPAQSGISIRRSNTPVGGQGSVSSGNKFRPDTVTGGS